MIFIDHPALFIWEARLWTDPQPFTLVIEIDAWNIRERDDWGQNKELLLQDKKPERWHWVYMATVFRLDHRGHTAGQRAVISNGKVVQGFHSAWSESDFPVQRPETRASTKVGAFHVRRAERSPCGGPENTLGGDVMHVNRYPQH